MDELSSMTSVSGYNRSELAFKPLHAQPICLIFTVLLQGERGVLSQGLLAFQKTQQFYIMLIKLLVPKSRITFNC